MSEEGEGDLRGHDLNLFVVFDALMRDRSVTRAAARLHMSQSAVSSALARMRAQYDDPLFTREAHGVAPTPRAKQMHASVAQALHALGQAIGGERRFSPTTDRFTLRLGMSDDLEALFMPPLLATVTPQHPGFSAYCVQTTRLRLAGLLESGDADLGVVANSAWGSHLRHRVLFASGYSCIYDSTQRGHDGEMSLDEYVSLPHVMISADATRGIVDSELDKIGARRFNVASTAHFAMAPLLLKQTNAVATMPSHVASVMAHAFGLTVVEPPIAMPTYEITAVWHQSRDADPAVQWMLHVLEQLTQTITTERTEA